MDCWSCGAERGDELFCTTCSKIQPVSEKLTYFDLLRLERKMSVKRMDVESAFRDASKKVHPDLYGQASSIERKLALRATEAVNHAYRALRDPRTRAEYLLSLEGATAEGRSQDPMFLMEMMELGETIDELKDEDGLESMQGDLQGRFDGLIARLTGYFDRAEGTRDDAAQALEELRYIRRLVDRVDQRLEDMT